MPFKVSKNASKSSWILLKYHPNVIFTLNLQVLNRVKGIQSPKNILCRHVQRNREGERMKNNIVAVYPNKAPMHSYRHARTQTKRKKRERGRKKTRHGVGWGRGSCMEWGCIEGRGERDTKSLPQAGRSERRRMPPGSGKN